MAHYAFLDENNTVTEVIVGVDESQLIEGLEPEIWYGNFRGQICKRASYNTKANRHISGGIPFRKNYASVGFSYDFQLDAFIPPKPYSQWILDEDSFLWIPPIPFPNDGNEYKWDEESGDWVVVEQEI